MDANDAQLEYATLYASAKNGWADYDLDGPRKDMSALFETVLEHVPAPVVEEGGFRMLVSNIDYNDFVGRIAIGRILSGSVAAN